MSSIMPRLARLGDVRELGGEVTQMAKRLPMSQPRVAYTVRKGDGLLEIRTYR